MLGCKTNDGTPFLAFSAEAGTDIGTYRTRGRAGSLFLGIHGGFAWETISTTTGDNLSSSNLATLSAAGNFSVQGNIAALYNLSAGAFSDTGATNGFLAGATGVYSSRNTTAAAYHLSIYNPNGNVGGITTNGTTTTFATSSDHRRKYDVEPLVEFGLTPEQFDDLPNALLRVMLLQPSSYRRVEETDGPLHHGFIAHELQAVMPHAVVGEKDAVDEDGGEILQLVDHSKLVTDTVAGLQGLTVMVLDHFAALTAANDDRFSAIENRLDQLEAA